MIENKIQDAIELYTISLQVSRREFDPIEYGRLFNGYAQAYGLNKTDAIYQIREAGRYLNRLR